jgi:hypothetical protein
MDTGTRQIHAHRSPAPIDRLPGHCVDDLPVNGPPADIIFRLFKVGYRLDVNAMRAVPAPDELQELIDKCNENEMVFYSYTIFLTKMSIYNVVGNSIKMKGGGSNVICPQGTRPGNG